MTSRSYIAIVDRDPADERWSILFPDLPGCASDASSLEEAPAQAAEALALCIEGMIDDGGPLPMPGPVDGWPEGMSAADFTAPLRLLVPVEIPGRPVRVNVSLDEGLLSRVDRAAEQRGMTRSGYLAEAVRAFMRVT